MSSHSESLVIPFKDQEATGTGVSVAQRVGIGCDMKYSLRLMRQMSLTLSIAGTAD